MPADACTPPGNLHLPSEPSRLPTEEAPAESAQSGGIVMSAVKFGGVGG